MGILWRAWSVWEYQGYEIDIPGIYPAPLEAPILVLTRSNKSKATPAPKQRQPTSHTFLLNFEWCWILIKIFQNFLESLPIKDTRTVY